MKWITSDLHFGHKNILKFSPEVRGHYTDVDDMDRQMIEQWNDTVADDDLIYILGDVSFRKPNYSVEIVKSLRGQKVLVKGNHDYKNCKCPEFLNCFQSVQDYLEVYERSHRVLVTMFHYPISYWNECHHGSIGFHGHLHGGQSGLEEYRSMDVGYDATGKLLSDYYALVEELKQRPVLKRNY
jgi:calcineurin-like phosphoesterase family protein